MQFEKSAQRPDSDPIVVAIADMPGYLTEAHGGTAFFDEISGIATTNQSKLLRALETIAAQMLRLEQREHDLVSFDAGNFKALRAQELRLQAETAAEKVLRSGTPYAFPPMNSRERRLLHMAFKSLEGVETASSGEGPDRFLAVYPAGKTHLPVAPQAKPRGFGRR